MSENQYIEFELSNEVQVTIKPIIIHQCMDKKQYMPCVVNNHVTENAFYVGLTHGHYDIYSYDSSRTVKTVSCLTKMATLENLIELSKSKTLDPFWLHHFIYITAIEISIKFLIEIDKIGLTI